MEKCTDNPKEEDEENAVEKSTLLNFFEAKNQRNRRTTDFVGQMLILFGGINTVALLVVASRKGRAENMFYCIPPLLMGVLATALGFVALRGDGQKPGSFFGRIRQRSSFTVKIPQTKAEMSRFNLGLFAGIVILTVVSILPHVFRFL